MGSRGDAEDMLQDAWLRIHRVRHTYRPGEPLRPWVYAIARRVRVDSYRKRHRIGSRESAVEALPELSVVKNGENNLPAFEELVASQKAHRAYQRLRCLLEQNQFARPAHKGVAE